LTATIVARSIARTLPTTVGRVSAPIGSMLARAADRHPTVARVAAGAPIWILAALITALAWPFLDLRAAPGLDRSWQIGLHLGNWMDLRHGVDLIFTYGPLGFLSVPQPYLGGTSALALVASGAVYFSLVAVLLIEARRVVPLWAAALVVLVIARTFVKLPPFEAFQALMFIACVEALAGRIRLPAPAIAAAFGIAAGVATLGKLNVGVFVAAMAGVTALAIDPRWWRGLGVFVAAAVATDLGLWIVTGQRLGDIGAFASGALQTISGYSEAMGLDIDPVLLWIYPAFVGVAVLFGWTAYRMSADWPRGRRLGLLVVCLILGFAMWKTAFTRGFPAYVFATSLVGLAVIGAPLRDRRLWLTSLLVVGVAFLATAKLTPASYVDVVASARSLMTETATAILPSRADRVAERNRASLRRRYALDPTTLGALAGRRVSVDPVEAGVAFAYPELTWAPLPIMQSYAAYTPALDRLNADRLASADAPERILRSVELTPDPPDWLTRQRGRPFLPGEWIPGVVDGRYRWFEAPAAMLETFCRYRELSSIGSWQVLGLTGGSCGTAEPLMTVQAREGETVQVPIETRPGRFVTVRVHGLEPSLLDRVRTALFKADEWYATVGGVRYRLVAPTVSDGLLMAVPAGADGTGDFAFGPPIDELSIRSRSGGDRLLTYEFESVPLVGP
jgi:hypothetical protein